METHVDPALKEHKNILIVDDDPLTCEQLDMLFRVKGYQTMTANSGQDALSFVANGTPDLVLLDVMMPEMDGWETFERIRSISDLPVIFLTALTSGEIAAKALRLGVNDYLRKPYSATELLARIEILLVGSRHESRVFVTDDHPVDTTSRNPKIVAIIPTYNEERFIGSVVLKVRKYAETVIVVDDGSSDGTAQVASDAGAVVISHDRNRGKGAALKTAFSAVRDYRPSVVVMLDGDGQHLPEELSLVVEPVLHDEADIVVGSRYMESHAGVPRHRIWGHRAFNFLTSSMSGVSVSDSQSGYRAFSPRAVQAIAFYSDDFSVESEMQFIIKQNNLRLVEVPITIMYQDPPKRPVLSHGMIVLNGLLHLMGQYRPLLFFGLPGLIVFIAGVSWGAWVVEIYRRTEQLAVGYAMLSVLLGMLGMVGLSTGIILHSVRGLLTDQLEELKSTKRRF